MAQKQPLLYTKNDRGRYVPYTPPTPPLDNKLYRRLPNGKYEPVGMEVDSNMLTEGVWVISKKRSCTSYTSADHLRTRYTIEKVSDLHKPFVDINIAQLGYIDKIVESVYFDNLHTDPDRSPIDNFKYMVADIVNQITGKELIEPCPNYNQQNASN